MNSFAEFATQMNVCKVLSHALPRFYNRTGASAEFHFIHNPKSKEMELSIGFSGVKEVTQEHYNILLEEILDAEKLLTNEYIFNNASKFDNLKQFVFKHREETYQIIDKHKNG